MIVDYKTDRQYIKGEESVELSLLNFISLSVSTSSDKFKSHVSLIFFVLNNISKYSDIFSYHTVQSKAIAGAKSFGSFLYSAVNKAGKTVSEASAKIKKTVEENVSTYIFSRSSVVTLDFAEWVLLQ